MSENLHDMDDLFRDAINQHSDSPSPGVWESIDKNLDKDKVVRIRKKYYTLKWVAAILFIFSFSMGIYALVTRMKNKELARENKIKTHSIEKDNNHEKANPGVFDTTNTKAATISNEDNKKITNDKRETEADQTNAETDGTVKNITGSNTTNNSDSKTQKTPEGLVENRPNEIAKPAENKTGRVQQSKVILGGAEKMAKDYIRSGKTTNTDATNKLGKASLSKSGKARLKDANPSMQGKQSSSNAANRLNDNRAVIRTEVENIYSRPFDLYPTAKIEHTELLKTNTPPIDVTQLHPISLNSKALNDKAIKSNAKPKITKATGSSFSITPFVSADFASSNVDDDKPGFKEDDKHQIKDKETNGFSSTIGMLVSYNLANRWSIQSGLTYTSRITNIAPKTIYARPDDHGNVNYRFNCSAGYSFLSNKTGNQPANGDSMVSLASKNTLHYIGIPLFVKYNFSKGNFSLNPGIGLSANFLTNAKIETGTANQREVITDISGLNSSYFNGNISLEGAYKLSERLSISVAPSFRFGLSPINHGAPVKTYLNSFSVAGGVTIRL